MDLYLLMHSLLGSDSGFFSVKSISKSMKSEDDGGNLTFTLPRRGAIYNLLENHKKNSQLRLVHRIYFWYWEKNLQINFNEYTKICNNENKTIEVHHL